MNGTREDAILFATSLQQLFLSLQEQSTPASLASIIEPLLPALERYAPLAEVQAQLDGERKAQETHQEMLASRRRQEIEQFALHAPKFP